MQTIALILHRLLQLRQRFFLNAGYIGTADAAAGSDFPLGLRAAAAQAVAPGQDLLLPRRQHPIHRGVEPAVQLPGAEILEQVKPLLAEQGIDLEIVQYNDYNTPNDAVEDGSLDANYFQHITYMNNYNEANGTHLVNAGVIHYEPFGLYAGKTASLDALADGAQIAVPNDTTNEARALLLLEQEGLIKLADGVGINATTLDIVENSKNLDIVELEAAQIPSRLADVDMAVINGNYALDAGLKVADALAIEAADGTAAQAYENVIAVKEGNENNEAIKALVEALQSDTIRDYINDTYNGAVVPMF